MLSESPEDISPSTNIYTVGKSFDKKLQKRMLGSGLAQVFPPSNVKLNLLTGFRHALELYTKGVFQSHNVNPIIPPGIIVKQTLIDAAAEFGTTK